ncbi:MAG: GTP 3',8-cyclase MoaA, partial [Acidobacteria bacterium]|nr:GTP 3',8-cyclase MoaA [Acidobacteriota bacterium]
EQLKTAGLHRVNISLDTLNAKHFHQITGGGKIQDVMAGIIAAKKCGLYPIKINCVITENSEQDLKIIKNFALKNNLQARFIPLMNLKPVNVTGLDRILSLKHLTRK